MRTQIVGRFRRRVDAEGHLRILKRMIPNVSFEIMFDITPEHTDSADDAAESFQESAGERQKGKSEREFPSPADSLHHSVNQQRLTSQHQTPKSNSQME